MFQSVVYGPGLSVRSQWAGGAGGRGDMEVESDKQPQDHEAPGSEDMRSEIFGYPLHPKDLSLKAGPDRVGNLCACLTGCGSVHAMPAAGTCN